MNIKDILANPIVNKIAVVTVEWDDWSMVWVTDITDRNRLGRVYSGHESLAWFAPLEAVLRVMPNTLRIYSSFINEENLPEDKAYDVYCKMRNWPDTIDVEMLDSFNFEWTELL